MNSQQQVTDLLNFIDCSPSPWHAVATIEHRLQSQGFQRLLETDTWSLTSKCRYYVIRDDSSIVAFVVGTKSLPESGFKIIGAHTDSPSLRVKPHPVIAGDQLVRLAVEVYGGPILATFTDRDLSLAGRVAYRQADGNIASRLVCFPQALLRLPNLAIHMNRAVNEDGLKLNKQNDLAAILSATQQQLPASDFQSLLAKQADLQAEQILSWELNIYDTQKGSFWGANQEFYCDSQLDNLASCHAGLSAFLDPASLNSGNTLVCALFDHEEVGSESCKGAAGSFLPDVLQRIANSQAVSHDQYQRTLANSFMVSADMAHAYHPSYPAAYEPNHKIIINQGPVIKINANHRYASECLSEAQFMAYCQQAEVPFQKYAHRGDLACGSTIGPISSSKLGIRTVDVGNPMWAMHSIRESAGVEDHGFMIKALSCFFAN